METPTIILVGEGSQPPSEERNFASRFPVTIQNVGRGVARDVTAKWSFDAHAFAELLAPLEEIVGGRVWVEDQFVHLEGGPGNGQWAARMGYLHRLGSVLPPPSGRSSQIRLDSAFLQLAATYFSSICTPDRFGGGEQWQLPPLLLDLSYRDMEGTLYKKQLSMQATLSMVSPQGLGDETGEWVEIGNGELVVEESSAS